MLIWDVFISHNRRHKPWVRAVVEQWRSQGLRVFYDEDSINPGESVIDKIEEGVEKSRYVVLVLSPQSLESQWVALETSLVVISDPTAKRRRLVPVLIEPTDHEKIRPSIRTINIIDLSDPESRQERYEKLTRHLGIKEKLEFPLLRGAGGEPAATPEARPRRVAVLRGALSGATCGVIVGLVTLTPIFRGLEEWCQDECFVYRGRRGSDAKLVVIGLDDASLARLPKPLSFVSPELAKVVGYLHERRAAAIGLDVMVPEDLDGFKGLAGEELGLAAARAGKVVLPAMRVEGRLLRPLRLWRTGSPMGLVDLTEDPDHFLRRQRLASKVGGEDLYQFALALLHVAGLVDEERPDGQLRVNGRVVPLEPGGLLRINYVGPAGTVPSVSFQDALTAACGGPPLGPDLEGAIVIIGATARSLGDYHATPYSNEAIGGLLSRSSALMAGSEIHANIAATLADGAFITTPSWSSPLLLVLLTGASLGAAFARLSLLQGAIVAALHHLAWRGFCLLALCVGPWRVAIVAVLMTGILCYGVAFVGRWRLSRRMLGAVKSEAIAQVLEGVPRGRQLGARERTVTVMCASIRDFRLFSADEQRPERVVVLLNAYFAEVVPILEGHGAMVDRYLGGGVRVLFGVPEYQPDHAARAVRAATAMVRRVHELGPRWAALGRPGMQILVGVHTGPAIVGMIGSPRRLEYTAIGPAVDTASQIESANTALGTEILVSESTYQAVPPPERTRLGLRAQSELVKVEDKDDSLKLHRVLVRGAGPRDGGADLGRGEATHETYNAEKSGPRDEELAPGGM